MKCRVVYLAPCVVCLCFSLSCCLSETASLNDQQLSKDILQLKVSDIKLVETADDRSDPDFGPSPDSLRLLTNKLTY